MMMGANLVGFVIGTEGTKFFISEVFGTVQGQSNSMWAKVRV